MDRKALTDLALQLGTSLNTLRTALLAAKYVFCAGLVRAAEEAVLVVYNSLNDAAVPESEL